MQFLSVVVGSVVGDVLPSAPGFTVVVVVLHFLGPEMAAALNRKNYTFLLWPKTKEIIHWNLEALMVEKIKIVIGLLN